MWLQLTYSEIHCLAHPRLKPIHHFSPQNRIRGFKKHRSFAFSIHFLNDFSALMGASTAAKQSNFSTGLCQGFGEDSSNHRGWTTLPELSSKILFGLVLREGLSSDAQKWKISNDFFLPFLYYKGFLRVVFELILKASPECLSTHYSLNSLTLKQFLTLSTTQEKVFKTAKWTAHIN